MKPSSGCNDSGECHGRLDRDLPDFMTEYYDKPANLISLEAASSENAAFSISDLTTKCLSMSAA
jgi:hypothetical protein